jgi:hypothetical protein
MSDSFEIVSGSRREDYSNVVEITQRRCEARFSASQITPEQKSYFISGNVSIDDEGLIN